MVAPGTVCVTIVASEAVFAACPVSGATVSVRFFVRFGLVIGFDRHKIRPDREVIIEGTEEQAKMTALNLTKMGFSPADIARAIERSLPLVQKWLEVGE